MIPGLTLEQIQRLLSLLEAPSANGDHLSGNTLWMSDTVASCHMTGNVEDLQGTERILPISIGLPDRTNTMASYQGAINLGKDLSLKGVLYVPSLQCNLISIAKLCKDMRCLITFSDDACVL